MTAETQVPPELLLEKFAHFPHSEPIINTFKRSAEDDSFRSIIAPPNEQVGVYLFQIHANSVLRGRENNLSVVLSGDPIEELLHLYLSWDGDLPTISSIHLRSGYESRYPYEDLDFGTHRVTRRFISDAKIEGTFDPTLSESKWLMATVLQFANESDAYFIRLGGRPEPIVVSEEEYIDYQPKDREFLASLGIAI